MLTLRICVMILVIGWGAARALGAPPALIEVKVFEQTLQGKVVAHTRDWFWILGQDGRLQMQPSDRVSNFRQISPRFSPWSFSIVRDQLQREFGKSFSVAATRHYLVCAHEDRRARAYAETFEELFRTFQMYFSVRGFKVPEPEFPLVAIIFPSGDAFFKYAAREKVAAVRGLKGYYLLTSNRIALFEEGDDRLSWNDPAGDVPELFAWGEGPSVASTRDFPFAIGSSSVYASIQGSLKDTMIHEGTHQAAFNTGLHTRVGVNPKWIVEGLATVFEAPGVRNSSANTGVKSRLNHERQMWFGNFAKARRKPQSLESFIVNDDFFDQNVLDAYSQAWALTFFLNETRPRNYADLLRAMAARDPLLGYPPEARLADFQKAVTKDLKLLEAEFLRFMAELR
jgi:Protein of unknown function (DUF1570)